MEEVQTEHNHNNTPGNYGAAKNLRNFIFGVEDSLVSTVGLLSGIAVGGIIRSEIILTGVILIFVEAFSMGVGSLLSEHSSEEYLHGRDIPIRMSVKGGFIMFISYFLAGFIPLSPYFFLEIDLALKISILFSLIALFVLGGINAKISKLGLLRHGLEMLIIGGIAVGIGVIVAIFIR